MDFYDKVLSQIKENNLIGLEKDFLISQLCVLNNKSYAEIRNVVEDLELSKELNLNSKKNKIERVDKDTFIKNSKEKYLKIGEKSRKQKYDKKIVEFPHSVENNQLLDDAYAILAKKDNKHKVRNVSKIKGKIERTKAGYGFLIPFDESVEDVFIPERELNNVFNDDVVVASLTKTNLNRSEGKIIQVVERGKDSIVGKISILGKNAFVSPDDVKFGADIFIPKNEINGASNGQKVVCKITKYFANKKNPEGVVVEVLGDPDKIETEVLSIIRTYNFNEKFPDNVIKVAEMAPDKVNPDLLKGRYNYTKEITFTIDGEDSRDLDDAVSLTIAKNGNRVLGVHIADVGEYVKLNNVFDKEAFKRGTSVYFPNIVLPMLPRQLSNGICSLNENEERLTLSVFIEFDKNANVVDYKFYESVIKSSKRFTYTCVQAIFDGDEKAIKENERFVLMLNQMRELSGQLLDKRKNRGGIDFNIPEVQVYLNELGGVFGLEKRVNDESHKLIEAFMISANECVAEYFYKLKIPFVYRIHEKPNPEKLSAFVRFVNKLGVQNKINSENVSPKDIQELLNKVKDDESEFAVNKLCLRSMQKAKYSPNCIGHFGLASKYYCHFTSPIRRYPDLTIHRIIKDYINNRLDSKKLAETRNFVFISSVNSSDKEVLAEKAERDVDDLYRAYYMSDKIGMEFEGIVSGVTKFGVFVLLDNTVEGMIRLEDLPNDSYEYLEEDFVLKGHKNSFFIGKKLNVKCVSSDIHSREINFVLI